MSKIRTAVLEEETGKRVVSAMLRVERSKLGAASNSTHGPALEWWAVIDGNATLGTGTYKYAWTEQYRTATGWETNAAIARSGTTASGWAANASEPAAGPIRTGSIVRMWMDYSPTGGAYFSCLAPPTSLIVRVKQNGGAQGDGTAYATYTYDAYDFADETCTGTAMTGGPFSVLTGGTSSYSSGSAARIAPVAVNVAPTGSPAELLTLPDGTQMLRNVGETIFVKNCTNNDYAASDLGYA